MSSSSVSAVFDALAADARSRPLLPPAAARKGTGTVRVRDTRRGKSSLRRHNEIRPLTSPNRSSQQSSAQSFSLGQLDMPRSQTALGNEASHRRSMTEYAPVSKALSPEPGNLMLWPGGQYSHPPKTADHNRPMTAMDGGPAPAPLRRGEQPRLLLDLEAFISRELSALNCPAQGIPSTTRLQVFRQAFELFVDSFTTYRPLLSVIKSEYDTMFDYLQGRIRDLEPLQVQLATSKAEMEQALSQQAAQHEQRLQELDEETKRERSNEGQLEDMRNQLAYTQSSLEKTYSRLREQTDQLRQLENKVKNLQVENTEASVEIKDLQGSLDAKTSELDKLKRVLDGMVPEEQMRTTNMELQRLQGEVDVLVSENHSLSSNLRDTSHRLVETQTVLQQLRDSEASRTPRPSLPSNARELYPDLDASRSTQDLFNDVFGYVAAVKGELDLLRENSMTQLVKKKGHSSPVKEPSGQDFFQGLGSSQDVPRYLRFKGRIRNRHLSKAQTESFIKDVMREKSEKEKDKAPSQREPLEDFVYLYLHKRLGIQSMIAEWGYSLVDALKRFEYDADCELFARMLSGDVSDEVYFDQIRMLERLYKGLQKTDMEDGGKLSGYLTKSDFRSFLRRFFPLKSEDDLQSIFKALEQDCPKNVVEYRKLFEEDREGDQGAFVEEIRDQFLAERTSFLQEISTALADNAQDGTVTTHVAKMTMSILDPKKGRREILEYVARGFGKSPGAVNNDDSLSISVEEFEKNLRRGIVRRSTRKGRGRPGVKDVKPIVNFRGHSESDAEPSPTPSTSRSRKRRASVARTRNSHRTRVGSGARSRPGTSGSNKQSSSSQDPDAAIAAMAEAAEAAAAAAGVPTAALASTVESDELDDVPRVSTPMSRLEVTLEEDEDLLGDGDNDNEDNGDHGE